MEKTIEQITKSRELKLERIFLLEEFENCEESYFMSYEQWLRIRKLRKDKDKKKYHIKKDIPTIKTFSFCKTEMYIPSYVNEEKYIKRVQEEYEELRKFESVILWISYRNRHNRNYYYYEYCDSDEIHFESKNYLAISFKCVLDEREHIERNHLKGKKYYTGKKDRNNGRKNPTNRK